jgi:hypothetical protein
MRARSALSKEFDMNAVISQSQVPARATSRTVRKGLAIALGALALACSGGAAQAQSHGGFHGGGWHGGGYHGGGYYRGGGWGFGPWFGLGLGLGLAAPLYYDQPDVVYVNPPVYYPPLPATAYATPAPVAPAPAADPIFYPRNGQTAAQVEADRQACNRWATTQPGAMNDGSVFQRATFACMDGRGYSAR